MDNFHFQLIARAALTIIFTVDKSYTISLILLKYEFKVLFTTLQKVHKKFDIKYKRMDFMIEAD